MGGFLGRLLSNESVLTPTSRHNFPPILEEYGYYPSHFLSLREIDGYKVPCTCTTNFLLVL